ncbi:unnamed protein product, partial [Closterium sp. Yama58-4]
MVTSPTVLSGQPIVPRRGGNAWMYQRGRRKAPVRISRRFPLPLGAVASPCQHSCQRLSHGQPW